jgi:uncharacterized membrane protein (UPF0127 family)
MKNILYIFALVVLVSCSSNKKPKPNPNLPPKYAISTEPQFKYEGNLWFLAATDTVQSIKIEIANTDARREQGLMHRKSMEKDQGMLFIFDDERRQSFWMKNTHISLDIVFVNSQMEIVHIAENTEPYSLKSIPSFEYAQYVVEVNAGFCRKFGVKVGQNIGFVENKHQ